MALYAGGITILPRYHGSMKGRPGALVAWSMTPAQMQLTHGFEIKRHWSGQTGDTMLRRASCTAYGGTQWDYVPGFVPRYNQLNYNDTNQYFGGYSVRQRGQTVPCNAGQIIRSFTFMVATPAARANKTLRFQIWNPSGVKVWESEYKLVDSTSYAWISESPNYICLQTGKYRLTMLATSQEHSSRCFQVLMDSRNPYPWGNAVYYWDGGSGYAKAWYTNPGWSMVFGINTTVWAFVDHYAPGSGELTYWVYPYGNVGQFYWYKSGKMMYHIRGVWLIPVRRSFGNRFSPTSESLATCIRTSQASSPIEFRTPEHQEIFHPIGKRAPVIKSTAPPGYEFTIEGHIRDFAGLSGDEYRRRLEILYGYSNELQIMFVGQGMSFPVFINNLKIKPIKAHWFEVSLDCYQSGGFTIPEMLTVPS